MSAFEEWWGPHYLKRMIVFESKDPADEQNAKMLSWIVRLDERDKACAAWNAAVEACANHLADHDDCLRHDAGCQFSSDEIRKLKADG